MQLKTAVVTHPRYARAHTDISGHAQQGAQRQTPHATAAASAMRPLHLVELPRQSLAAAAARARLPGPCCTRSAAARGTRQPAPRSSPHPRRTQGSPPLRGTATGA